MFELIPIRSVGSRIEVRDAYARRLAEQANRKLGGSLSPLRWKARRFVPLESRSTSQSGFAADGSASR